jgi:7,8-dihydro-6-hydroxymethylpterin-pyrophosphokinase
MVQKLVEASLFCIIVLVAVVFGSMTLSDHDKLKKMEERMTRVEGSLATSIQLSEDIVKYNDRVIEHNKTVVGSDKPKMEAKKFNH